MSSRTLRRWALRTTKHSSRSCTTSMVSPGQTSLAVSFTSDSNLLSMERIGANNHQMRLFHHTPARRLFESPDAIVAACLGLAGGVALTRLFPASFARKAAPVSHHSAPVRSHPFSWPFGADQKTRDDVETIISAGFKMASKEPPSRRNQSYRQASFQVPHEMARLNADAPRFRVEVVSPMPPLNKTFREMREMGAPAPVPFDPEKESRVFLYFPNDATRATAAFVAINTEFRPVEERVPDGRVAVTTNEYHLRLNMAAANIWICQTVNWRRHHPHVLDLIEPGPLPVIVTFREWASEHLWDTTTENFLNLDKDRELMKLTMLTH